VASWRMIFWINVPVVLVLGFGFWLVGRAGGPAARGDDPSALEFQTGRGADDRAANDGKQSRGRFDFIGTFLAVAGLGGLLVGLDAPGGLATSASFGQAYTPEASGPWSPFSTPIVLASLGLLVLFVAWELAAPAGVRPLVRMGKVAAVLTRADVPGALLLAGILGCIVVAFSTADPSRQVVASSAPALGPLAAVLVVLFLLRERHTNHPLIEPDALAARPAWGSLVVNLALGGALMAALIDVPLYARSTVDPNSEVSAALVLVRFLVAVPVGAIIGGVLCRRRTLAPVIAALGMGLASASFIVMTTWNQTSLGGGPRPSDVELIVCGLGFGLAIAPVNVAILGAVKPSLHALASALAVVARTIGMLAGLSVLTAIALHRFYQSQAKIGSPLVLCPKDPSNCAPYNTATTNALIGELHTIFAGAAVCAIVAGVLAAVLLRPESDDLVLATVDGEDTTRWSGRRPSPA
jgi:hypothetical protein